MQQTITEKDRQMADFCLKNARDAYRQGRSRKGLCSGSLKVSKADYAPTVRLMKRCTGARPMNLFRQIPLSCLPYAALSCGSMPLLRNTIKVQAR